MEAGGMVYYNPALMYGPDHQRQQYQQWYQHYQYQQQWPSCMHQDSEDQKVWYPPVHGSPEDGASASGSDLSSPGPPTNHRQTQRQPAVLPPFGWLHRSSYQNRPSVPGKTRTKDKYRVVYTDHQRLELEKEFHYSRYITIRRKAELATNLGLSERQVKIWFQNRRAKERKQLKKREELLHKEKMQQIAML